MEIQVDVSGSAIPELRALVESLTGPKLVARNERGGEAAVKVAAAHSKRFYDTGGWKKAQPFPGLMEDDFGGTVAERWQVLGASETQAVIFNDTLGYHRRVMGGEHLTQHGGPHEVPLIPKARGRTLNEYEAATGQPLFTLPGRGRTLFERAQGDADEMTSVRMVGTDRKGRRVPIRAKRGIRKVYRMIDNLILPPAPQALPPDGRLAKAFLKAWWE